MSLKLSYEQAPAIKDNRGTHYIKVQSATEIQIKQLLLARCVKKTKDANCLPFFIESIQQAPFYIEMSMGSLIPLLSIFKDEPIVMVAGPKEKRLTKNALINFMFS